MRHKAASSPRWSSKKKNGQAANIGAQARHSTLHTEYKQRAIDVVRLDECAPLAVGSLRLLAARQIDQTQSTLFTYEAL